MVNQIILFFIATSPHPIFRPVVAYDEVLPSVEVLLVNFAAMCLAECDNTVGSVEPFGTHIANEGHLFIGELPAVLLFVVIFYVGLLH